MKIKGEEHIDSLGSASNYASSLIRLQRFEEAKALLCKTIPVARRTLGDDSRFSLALRKTHAQALCMDAGSTLDDLRDAVSTLEDAERIARRVLGAAHPITLKIEHALPEARATLGARETPSPGSA